MKKIPEATTPEPWNHLEKELGETSQLMIEYLYKIDILLMNCNDGLDELQPHEVGRLGIKFWKHRKIDANTPYCIEWRKYKTSGKYYARELAHNTFARHVKTRGAFAVTAPQVLEIAKLVGQSMQMRAAVVMLQSRVKAQTKDLVGKNSGKMSAIEAVIAEQIIDGRRAQEEMGIRAQRLLDSLRRR